MSESKENARLEMFCDGVFAIAITLLILDIKIPPIESVHSMPDAWRALADLWPAFFALSLSFLIIFIDWIGHHNLLKILDKTSAKFLLANGFLLFTVILIPFATAYMAEYLNTPYAKPAIVVYCFNGLLTNIGWRILLRYTLIPHPLATIEARVAILKQLKKGNNYGFYMYSAIVLLALWLPYMALVLSLLMWIYWLYLGTRPR